MKKYIILQLLLCLSVGLFAQQVPLNKDIKTGKLDNGLTYYILKNAKPEDKVELRLVVNAGAILESDKQRGLAHFTEHMAFNGTKNFKKNELVDYLQSVGVKFGAHLNAYTSFDETVYILPVPSDDKKVLENGMQILEDWAHNLLFDGEEIDKERGVVLEEYRLGRGASMRMLENYLPKVLYGSQYVNRLPIGTKDVLENFEYQTLKDFYNDWYRPDLMAVIAVGDIDVNDMEKMIKSHFSKLQMPANPKERKEFEVPNHEETFICVESDKEAPYSQVSLYYKQKEPHKADQTEADYFESLKRNLMSQMINNRLDDLRQSQDPPFINAGSYFGGMWARGKAAFQGYAITSETGQLKALRTLLTENKRVVEHGFTDAEFERAKRNMMAQYEKLYAERDKMESSRKVGELIRHFLEGEMAPGITWEYNFVKGKLNTITLAQVNGLIGSYISDENRVIVFTGPEKEGLEKVAKSEIEAVLAEVKDMEVEPYMEDELPEKLLETNPLPGKITKRESNEQQGITYLTLSNGMKVIYKRTDFKNDEILFRGFSYGGSSTIDDETFKRVRWGLDAMDEGGVGPFTKSMLEKYLSGKVINVRPYIGSNSEGLRGSFRPKDMITAMELIHMYFMYYELDPQAFSSYIEKQNQLYKNLAANPEYYYQFKRSEFLASNHPRGYHYPTEKDWMNIDMEALKRVFNDKLRNSADFTMVFVGNVAPAEMESLFRKYLASIPGDSARLEMYKDHGIRPPKPGEELIVKKGTEQKSQVMLYYGGETKYDGKEDYHLQCLGEILRITLVENLREEMSGVYGIGAYGYMNKIPYGNYGFSIVFPCGPDNVEKLIEAAKAEVQKIIENGPTEKDLNKIKEGQRKEFKESLKENGSWLNWIYLSEYENKDINKMVQQDKAIDALTAEDIQKVAKKYLTENPVKCVLYPEGFETEK